MANKALDMGRAQKYLNDAGQPLKARGIKTYALPLAAELGLSQEEAKEFRAKIAQEFDLLVALGGDDINPTLYHEPPTYARGTISLARDEAEMKMIQDYTKSGRGFFFGICRGSQMLGVSVGCGLVQDIPRELGITGHQTGHHPIFLQSAESNHLAKIFPAETEEIVNTYHHQAVKVIRNDQLRVVATDPRGVVEATELTNGRGIGVQFHPELMRNQMRTKFFDYLAEEARRAYGIRHRVGCQEKFSTLKRKD
jgi:putative glutamine amidotransferase